MTFIKSVLEIPVQYRLAALFALGVVLGNLVNLAVDHLTRRIRRSGSPRRGTAPGQWLDWVPLVGWWTRWLKSDELGTSYWLRPLTLELLTAILLTGLYWWEIDRLGLVDMPLDVDPMAAAAPPPETTLLPAEPTSGTLLRLHAVYGAHAILVLLMLVASFIDLEERIIPDSVTVPGTLLGLILAVFVSWSLLPNWVWPRLLGGQFVEFVSVLSPHAVLPGQPAPGDVMRWPPYLDGFPQPLSLLLALACFWAWCAALLPRLWLPSRGFTKAVRMFIAHAMRSPSRSAIGWMALLGGVGITVVWSLGGLHWVGLLSSLAGIVAAGGFVWAVRIVAGMALGREAIGFGDVTLLAMIGSFLGWQASLLVFFLAPFAGSAVGIIALLLRRERQIPYGPYLCLAALAVMVGWKPLWVWLEPILAQLGWYVPLGLVGIVAAMAVLLNAWRLLIDLWSARGEPQT